MMIGDVGGVALDDKAYIVGTAWCAASARHLRAPFGLSTVSSGCGRPPQSGRTVAGPSPLPAVPSCTGAFVMLLHIGREPSLELAHQRAEARHDGDRLEQRP